MKNNFILLILCAGTLNGNAQFLTESADGKGAVILPLNGLSIGFDIGKAEIAVGANNFSKALDSNNSKAFRNWFFGSNLAVKNSSGIGNLFQSGDIVPAANFLGFLGFNVNNNQSILDEWKKSSVTQLATIERNMKQQLVDSYRSDIVKYIEAASENIIDAEFRQNTIQELVKKIAESSDGFALASNITSILTNKAESLKGFVDVFKALVEPRQKEYFERITKIDATKEIDVAFDHFLNDQIVKRLSPFIFGGIEARNFSLYTGLNASSLPKSFIDTLYRGGQFGIGINAQIGRFWLGATYAYIDGDNFSNLTSKEYTLRTTDPSGNQTLISEKKITGYSGKYAKVGSNQLNIDFLKEFKLGDTSRVITNLYYRGTMASRDTALLKNISNLGLSVYFLGNKSKFLGGLYVELPDIDNNIEKTKPESERSIRPPLKKLTFGVIMRVSVNSIFGFVNRPRKPD